MVAPRTTTKTGASNGTSGKKEQRRALHQELSRNQILDAAEEIFADKGFHEATIKEIAQLAEFSVGAVYSFFENKNDLFVQIYTRRGAEFMAGMRRVLGEDKPPRQLLADLARYEIDFFRQHRNFGRVFLRGSGVVLGQLQTLVDVAVAENYADAMAMQAGVFARLAERGELRDGDPNVMARLFSGLVAAYQSNDPVVMEGAPPGTETLSVDEFLAILEGAFLVLS